MFDPKLRDKLLFEDKHFTYIRRYFWAYNTLAVVNNSIRAMMDAYYETFTDSFWAGTHATLWPHPSPETADAAAYREHMASLRRELDKVVQELGEVLKHNARTRKEIENLRDQLFSGSSIKESRRAIEQGDNIRILTMISMIFLPLTFVTVIQSFVSFIVRCKPSLTHLPVRLWHDSLHHPRDRLALRTHHDPRLRPLHAAHNLPPDPLLRPPPPQARRRRCRPRPPPAPQAAAPRRRRRPGQPLRRPPETQQRHVAVAADWRREVDVALGRGSPQGRSGCRREGRGRLI